MAKFKLSKRERIPVLLGLAMVMILALIALTLVTSNNARYGMLRNGQYASVGQLAQGYEAFMEDDSGRVDESAPYDDMATPNYNDNQQNNFNSSDYNELGSDPTSRSNFGLDSDLNTGASSGGGSSGGNSSTGLEDPGIPQMDTGAAGSGGSGSAGGSGSGSGSGGGTGGGSTGGSGTGGGTGGGFITNLLNGQGTVGRNMTSGQNVNCSGTRCQFQNPLGNGTNSLEAFLNKLLDVVILIGSIAVVFSIIIAGLKYVTAHGDEGKISSAHTQLTWTVVGAAILLGAKVIAMVIQNTVRALS
jgi:hypothetical protein